MIVDLEPYNNPITTQSNIQELQNILVQTVIDYIKKHNLEDIYEVNFHIDGLTNDAIEFGEWTPGIDSYIGVVGLQEDEIGFRVRKFIGENM